MTNSCGCASLSTFISCVIAPVTHAFLTTYTHRLWLTSLALKSRGMRSPACVVCWTMTSQYTLIKCLRCQTQPAGARVCVNVSVCFYRFAHLQPLCVPLLSRFRCCLHHCFSMHREFSIEKALDKMGGDWDGMAFELGPWKETGGCLCFAMYE